MALERDGDEWTIRLEHDDGERDVQLTDGDATALWADLDRTVGAVAKLEAPSRDQVVGERSEVDGATWASCTEGVGRDDREVARLREANRAACDALVWIKDHDGSPPSFRMAAENALRVQEALAGGGQ